MTRISQKPARRVHSACGCRALSSPPRLTPIRRPDASGGRIGACLAVGVRWTRARDRTPLRITEGSGAGELAVRSQPGGDCIVYDGVVGIEPERLDHQVVQQILFSGAEAEPVGADGGSQPGSGSGLLFIWSISRSIWSTSRYGGSRLHGEEPYKVAPSWRGF